ncbi:MAG: hypothetical protein J6N73_07180 [Prevotella sp.]|nr:hypothetical protein [Prevotella sp.]
MKYQLLTAKIVSVIFTPFYLPITGMVAVFLFSYLRIMPWTYKLSILLMVYLFTVLIPTMLIRLYRRYQGWSLLHLLARERRVIPYVISILCYFTCYNILTHHNVPHIITSILVAALVVQILCALVNVWWKISTHTAAIGGVTGGVIAFAFIFNFNPIWWLTLVILLGGLVGSSRMMLRQHTLAQVVCGFLLGMLAVIVTVLT